MSLTYKWLCHSRLQSNFRVVVLFILAALTYHQSAKIAAPLSYLDCWMIVRFHVKRSSRLAELNPRPSAHGPENID